MTAKSIIFLTTNNEHCYLDLNTIISKDGLHGRLMILELNKTGVSIIENNNENLTISIRPESILYQILLNLENES